jgi:hypothetical protein
MPFESSALVVKEVDYRRWSIQEALVYHGEWDTWKVPRGFITDFASVPRFAVWLVPITGVHTKPAILHDWFCEFGIAAGLISARDADGVFRRILREMGLPFLLRWMVWTGVRWGALGNPIRRPGWIRDAPLVVLISLIFAPFVLPAFIATGLGLLVWMLLESVTYVLGKGVKRWSARRAAGRGSSTVPVMRRTGRSDGGGSARRSRR